jgi:phosphoadenosine phosphosulfate reductase|tara:strand:+ start:296 stop:1018 length:723 start_codon:yes stop_codon:yes gene_type:complete
MTNPLSNHKNVAFQFSGGKDSLALVHVLRPHWDRLTLYHVDTGDLLPEVREIVDCVEAMVPSFVRIETQAADWNERFGLPSDLVPSSCTPLGVKIGMSDRRLVDRFECCAFNIMVPMHNAALKDGCTLVIRGTKRADMKRLPAEDGPTGLGYDLWLPLLNWSDADVFAYLREVGAPICRVYENGVQSPECATCPAWWSEGRAAYLAKHHPDLSETYRAKLEVVAAEVAPMWAHLQREIAG